MGRMGFVSPGRIVGVEAGCFGGDARCTGHMTMRHNGSVIGQRDFASRPTAADSRTSRFLPDGRKDAPVIQPGLPPAPGHRHGDDHERAEDVASDAPRPLGLALIPTDNHPAHPRGAPVPSPAGAPPRPEKPSDGAALGANAPDGAPPSTRRTLQRRRARSSRFFRRLPQLAMLHQLPCWLRERSKKAHWQSGFAHAFSRAQVPSSWARRTISRSSNSPSPQLLAAAVFAPDRPVVSNGQQSAVRRRDRPEGRDRASAVRVDRPDGLPHTSGQFQIGVGWAAPACSSPASTSQPRATGEGPANPVRPPRRAC